MPDGSAMPRPSVRPGPKLPANCGGCAFRRADAKACQRHAPGTTLEEFEVTRWPLVEATDRCGEGAEVSDGDGPGITSCGWCIHWLQPEGQGVVPYHRQGLSRDWWEQSGFCTRHAPAPSAEELRRTRWRVTGVHDGCGDGEQIPEPAEEGESTEDAEEG